MHELAFEASCPFIASVGVAICLAACGGLAQPAHGQESLEEAFEALSPDEQDRLSEAIRGVMRRKAEAGDAVAQVGLGEIYHAGQGVPRDLVQAVHWYRLAANQANPAAAYALGTCYLAGESLWGMNSERGPLPSTPSLLTRGS